MKVRDVMIHDVVTIEPSASLVDAATRMTEANIGILPVVDEGEVRGVITDRDLVVRGIARSADLRSAAVGDCATTDPIVAHADWDIDRAIEIMGRAQIGRLPVIESGNRLVGIVTLSSLVLRSRKDRETLAAAKKISHRSVKGATSRRGSSSAKSRAS
jgi:CBS domain-containing protein